MNQPPHNPNQHPNQHPNSGMQTPPGYGAPQQPPPGYGAPGHSGPVPNSGSYPPPQSFRGATRQIFNPRAYKQPGSASWGAASLIISLVSILFCGLLSPLSLLLGLIGLVGKKRAKGAAFAGVVISGLQVAGWVTVIAAGLWQMAWTEGYAEQGGAPVVAAIEEFRNDHERVPHSLDELVEQGYLPSTWAKGLDDLDDGVREVVEGRPWGDFLAYKPGASADWTGTPDDVSDTGVSVRGGLDEWELDFGDAPDEDATHRTYGLTFIGADNMWGTHDDTAVNQAPSEPFELTRLWGGDRKTQEIAQKRRDLKALQRKLDGKVGQYEQAVRTAEESLAQTRDEIEALRVDRNLVSFRELQSDTRGKGLLKLAGQQQKLMLTAQKKLDNTRERLDVIDIQIRLLQNQEELAKLADSPQELAELQTLLDESEEVLETGGELGELDKLDEERAAEDWFKDTFR